MIRNRVNTKGLAWGVAIAAIIAVLWWLIFGLMLDVLHLQWKWLTQVFLGRFLFPGGWNLLKMSPWAMLFIGIALLVTVAVKSGAASRMKDGYSYHFSQKSLKPSQTDTAKRLRTAMTVIGALIVLCSVVFWWAGTNDKAASYAGSTTFVVDNPNDMPSNLARLVDGGTQSKDCAVKTDHGMPGCVTEGKFEAQWYTRNASAAGAKIVLKRTSGTVANTELLSDTLSYVYDDKGNGVWTAIRDGKSKTPIYGVASWSGSGNVEQCRFTGDNSIDQAFGGKWGSNLSDTIAAKFPHLFYEESDMWGYCDGDKPVVVIPVAEQENYAHRVTLRAAGVLVMTGTPSGTPSFQHVTDVKPGDFGGPVYPASLVDTQRDGMNMMAGRINKWFRSFGFETLDVKTQEGNASDYLLRSKTDDRLYWVTPMKSRKSDSQLVIAYSVTPADQSVRGTLNEQKVYVLADDDPRIVNLDDLEARTKEAIITANPGFFSGGGKLVEFLPADDGNWQVYAELGGRVVYRILVPADSRVRPQVASIDSSVESPPVGSEGQPSTPGPATGCGTPPSEMSDAQLATCLADLARELEARQK